MGRPRSVIRTVSPALTLRNCCESLAFNWETEMDLPVDDM